MTIPAFNTVQWFQIGTAAPEEARRFYGDMFGWGFDVDRDGDGYDFVRYPDADAPSGGISHTSGSADDHAVFFVLVQDVDETCRQAERCGGKVAVPTMTNANGLRFAHVEDPAGNRFGVFTPPAPA